MRKKPFFAYRSFWKEFDAMRRFAEIGVRQFAVFAVGGTEFVYDFAKPETALFECVK